MIDQRPGPAILSLFAMMTAFTISSKTVLRAFLAIRQQNGKRDLRTE